MKSKKMKSNFLGDCGDAFILTATSRVWTLPSSFKWEQMMLLIAWLGLNLKLLEDKDQKDVLYPIKR